jgi:iron complex outermembrane recepter protein
MTIRQIFIFLSAGILLLSQMVIGAEIHGRVLNERGEPVLHAAVSLDSLDIGAFTNEQGRFLLENVPAGDYLLRVSHIGCLSQDKKISLSTDEHRELLIRLQRDVLKMEEITVVGGNKASELLDSYRPLAVLGNEQLALRPNASLGQATAAIPGVQMLHQGPNVSKPVIRGLSNQRIAIVADGVQLEAQQWSEHHTPELDASAAEKIEVIRGPASLIYGGDAIGGVVQVWSAYQNGKIPEAFHGRLRLGFGSNELSRNGDIRLVYGNGKSYLLLNAGAKITDDYAVPGDHSFLIRQASTAFQQERLHFSAGMKRGETILRLNLKHYYEKQTLLGEGHWHNSGGGPDGTEPWYHVMGSISSPTRHQTIQLQSSSQTRRGVWNFDLSYQTDHRQGIPEGMKPQIDLQSQSTAGNGRFVYGNENYSGAVGISLRHKANQSLGPETLMPDFQQQNGGLFVFQQMRFGHVKISGGLRLDMQQVHIFEQYFSANVTIPEGTKNYGPILSGGLGIVWRPMNSDLAILLNSGTGWRAPTAVERYINGVHHASWRFEKGDPNLDIEKAWNTELIFRYGKGRFGGEMAFWRNEMQQFIFPSPTGEFSTLSQIPVYEIGGSDARLEGYEISVQLQISNSFSIQAGADGVRGRILENVTDSDGDGKIEPWLPSIPADRFSGGFTMHENHSGASLSLTAQRYSAQKRLAEFENILSNDSNLDGTNDQVQPNSYTLLNLFLGIPFKFFYQQEFSIEGRNLLNAQYYSHLSQYKGLAYDPGLNIIITWKLNF